MEIGMGRHNLHSVVDEVQAKPSHESWTTDFARDGDNGGASYVAAAESGSFPVPPPWFRA
ncbi:hypothetical protein BKG68_16450 [Mycobacteroides saopaulense]|uniref:Uncharacterized protein n=2 Tax=Mycobacteroides saopaulense TaxID=1578165 RepID=A0ABX3BZN1_9MYCO|nr:hypothetical protein BKG68_16450 [Mycobacteroides saopaulense]OHU09709.1 hypothetical protein BKG73_11115 [Mycobacteroides saopaulense]